MFFESSYNDPSPRRGALRDRQRPDSAAWETAMSITHLEKHGR